MREKANDLINTSALRLLALRGLRTRLELFNLAYFKWICLLYVYIVNKS